MNKIVVFFCLLLGSSQFSAQSQQQQEISGISTFVQGFARVEKEGVSFYIDTTGAYAFSDMYALGNTNYQFGDKYAIDQYLWEMKYGEEKAPKTFFSVFREKDNKWGVLAPNGTWILKPTYNYDDETFENYKAKPKPIKGVTPNPPALPQLSQFDTYGILDGVHFDVKKGNKWGVYNIETKKVTIPIAYDKFDYCGGCGAKSTYVYAQKNGKWGIVSFDNKVLLPFEYNHQHLGMRSDNWVQSFQKNGKQLIVHIPTKKEFVEETFEHLEILNYSTLSLKKNGKYALINAEGEEILPFEYDKIENAGTKKGSFGLYGATDYYGPWITAIKNGKAGLIDISGNWVLPLQFDVRDYYTFQIHGNYIIASQNQKFNVYDKQGNTLFKESYDAIDPSYEYDEDGKELLIFVTKKGDLHGFYNTKTKAMVSPAFHDLHFRGMQNYNDKNDVIEVIYKDKKGLYDFNGKQLLPVQYNAWKFFDSENFPYLLEVENDQKKGLYDLQKQKEILPPTYNSLYDFDKKRHPNLFTIFSNEKYGLYDLALNKEILAPEYEYFSTYANQKEMVVEKASLKGVIDLNGEIIIPTQYKTISFLNDEWWLFQSLDNKYAVYDAKHQRTTTINYPMVWETGDPRVLLVSNDSTTVQLYQTQKHQVLPQKYTKADVYGYDPIDYEYPILSLFTNGLARVEKKVNDKPKIGFINTSGETIIPIEYDFASQQLSNGLAILGKFNTAYGNYDMYHYGFADSTGKIVVQPKFDFSDGMAHYILPNNLMLTKLDIKTNKYKIGIADHSGKTIIEPKYDRVYPLKNSDGYLLVNIRPLKNETVYLSERDYIFGFADKNGKEIIPVTLEAIKDNLSFFLDEYAHEADVKFPLLAKYDGKWKLFTKDGKILPYKAENAIDFIEK